VANGGAVVVVPPVQASQPPPAGNATDGLQLKGTATLLPPVEIAWIVSIKVAGAAAVGRLTTCEVGLAVRVAAFTVIVAALVAAVIAGVMPPVVATLALTVQVADNPVPVVGPTVKLSGVGVVLRVIVEDPGVTVHGPEPMVAVTVAGSVVGLAGAKESAAVVVQVTLAVPAVTGLAGVQVSAGRLITGGAATAIVTVAEVVELGAAPVAVMVALAGPGVVGRLAETIPIVRVCRPAEVEVGLSVMYGQGETPQLEVKFTVPVVPNCCSCVVNEVVAALAWPMVKAVVNGPGGENCRLDGKDMAMETGIDTSGFEVKVPEVAIWTVPSQVTAAVRPVRVAGLIVMVSATGVPEGPGRLPVTAAVPPLMNNQLGGPLIWDTVAVKGTVPPTGGGPLRLRLVVTWLGEVFGEPAAPVNMAPAVVDTVLSTVGRLVMVRFTTTASTDGCVESGLATRSTKA